MNPLTRYATVLGACAAGLLIAAAAFAGFHIADESHSTLGSNWPNAAWRKWVVVEGYTVATETGGGAPTPDRPDLPASTSYFGDYEVTIHDELDRAFNGVSVCIDFSGCPDVRLSCDQLTAQTGQGLFGSTVCGNTDIHGKFTFKVQGAGKAKPEAGMLTTAGSPADTTVAGCAIFSANNVYFNERLKVTIYDVNRDGVSGADASLIALEATRTPAFNPAYARSDYNHDARTTGADAAASAIMATQAAASTETGSRVTGPYCP